MKLKFKHQKFQADAAKAVVDVFAGQPYLTANYLIDRGDDKQGMLINDPYFTGWCNQPIVPQLSDNIILENLNKVQRVNLIAPSPKLEGRYNLTIEMETGVGKTYTYIKTMYELNKHYGWSKFIVVVPSIAIREGVYKSFMVTQEHFAEAYGKKIRFFIYNSAVSSEIKSFLNDKDIYVMIINVQAFNSSKDYKRKILEKQENFNWCKPIELIAKTNPILIIDEPQSVEGKQAKEQLKKFNPLITLRYSATHKTDSIYNMVYRLDAMEAYNKRLVKKIAVKGVSQSGTTATEGFVYLESINLSDKNPMATISFDYKDPFGKNLDGGYYVSKEMGETTYNVGIIKYKDCKFEMTVNFRYPENVNSKEVIEKLKENTDLPITILSESNCLYFDPNTPFIKLLSEVYVKETNDTKNKPMTIGGGTYAKEAKNTVAFGSHFMDKVDYIHEPNEKIDLEDLFNSMPIYAHAIYALGNLK